MSPFTPADLQVLLSSTVSGFFFLLPPRKSQKSQENVAGRTKGGRMLMLKTCCQ